MVKMLKQPDRLKLGAHAFYEHQAAGGVILMAAALLALVLDNSSFAWVYDEFLQMPSIIQIGAFSINKLLL